MCGGGVGGGVVVVKLLFLSLLLLIKERYDTAARLFIPSECVCGGVGLGTAERR